MMHPWLENWGQPCDAASLENSLAKSFVEFVSIYATDVASIRGARRQDGAELIVVDVNTGRPQHPAYPLLKTEPIGILLPEKGSAPIVLALRRDFPDTPHQNWVPVQIPACLCVDDRPWIEARQTYTSGQLLFRIVSWLKRAGMGELHEIGRAPDPYFTGVNFEIVLPRAALAQSPGNDAELVGFIQTLRGRPVVIAEVYSSERHKAIASGGIVVTTYTLPPQDMRRLRHVPTTVAELFEEVANHGVDLASDLAAKIEGWAGVEKRDAFRLGSQLAVVLEIPVRNPTTREISRVDHLAFVTQQSLGAIGAGLGCLHRNTSSVGSSGGFVRAIPPAPKDQAILASIMVLTAAVHTAFDAELAATVSGLDSPDLRKAVLIGAGAIGSNMSEMLVREGRFDWTIVDQDYFLPHNVGRHTLGNPSNGAFKAEHVAGRLRSLRAGMICSSIVADFLEPHGPELTEALNNADVVIDTSASVPVSRAVSDLAIKARRVSAFFNPAGSAAVVMATDRSGEFDLRALEAAYYAEILDSPALADHLTRSADAVAFAGACRSLTNRIPASRAAVLSGLAAMGVSKALDQDNASLRIWSLSDDGGVTVSAPALQLPHRHRSLWDVNITPQTEQRLRAMRAAKLPRETGGVLMGVIDVFARRIDVIDAWDEPPDSRGSTAYFERGTGGLKGRVFDAMHRTMDQVRYVGEWHSHPRDHSTSPSSTDLTQILWLTKSLASDGCPALMIIVGDNDISVYMGATVDALTSELAKLNG